VTDPRGPADVYQLCANLRLAECNWPVEVGEPGALCASCELIRRRPNDFDTKGLAPFAQAERAKLRLIAELHELKLPIVGRDEDPDYGLAFDLLFSELKTVVHRAAAVPRPGIGQSGADCRDAAVGLI
jgi:hypothetical protein